MKIPFSKYHGTGNDFILIDNRNLTFPKENTALVAQLCHRRFGAGADGLILLEKHSTLDFNMVYYNSDGNWSSMCGNGGRCIVAFAHKLGVCSKETTFMAVDGEHKALVDGDNVQLQMKDVTAIAQINETTFVLDTGSPHYVKLVDSFPADFVETARNIRNSAPYKEDGINVNFLVCQPNENFIRTFERGVEDETYSCGTGTVAAALVNFHLRKSNKITIQTKGGKLQVTALPYKNGFKNIQLLGPAQFVYSAFFTTVEKVK